MAEYIEKEAALDSLLFEMCGTGYQSRAMSAVEKLPAASVAPVRHGQWIIDSAGGKIACSDCGCIYLGYNGRLTPNYCPNCGAKMDGGADHA